MRSMTRSLHLGALVAVVLVAVAAESHAGWMLSNPIVKPIGGDPIYEISFKAYLDPNSALVYGDLFTIYDIFGLSSNPPHTEPGGTYTFESHLLGVTPPGLVVTDSATEQNVTWSYADVVPLINASSSPLLLGLFTIQTLDLPLVNGADDPRLFETLTYAYDSHNDDLTDQPPGTRTITPHLAAVPEPSTILLAGAGGLSLLLLGRRRIAGSRTAA